MLGRGGRAYLPLTGQSSTVTDQQEEKLPLSILVAGGRDVVSALDEAGLPAAGADVFVAGDGMSSSSTIASNASMGCGWLRSFARRQPLPRFRF